MLFAGGMMKRRDSIGQFVLVLCMSAGAALAQQPSAGQRPPIIDMHVHAFGWDHMGNPPPPNVVTGKLPAARTDKDFMDAVLAELERHNVVKVVAGGPRQHVLRWHAADADRIIGGTIVARDFPLFDTSAFREDVRAGRVGVMGELALAYSGIAPNDPRMEPYWALAEELDVPVALHTALAPPNTPYHCCPKFRTSLGNPALLEEVLVRHPKLRIYLMHAGYPFLQETIAILHMYPQVYVDVGAISWTRPRDAFHEYLRALVREGFGKRIMFGSDQMMWPEAIGMAIDGIESASFLTAEQKRDIFFNNAVRFLRLDERSLMRRASK
ncbi:MAG TPA: amidohydrolase family protein [Gemmatimonadaceae bacterium]|jgi:predicted TIM-barrel fold metal-dependent hydrolase|nr:amidohydrolase family protein [Gemmatimonadaceae bacterium]